jgi:hypothetical protein
MKVVHVHATKSCEKDEEGVLCPWKVCGVLGRRVVSLEGVWCPWKACCVLGRRVVSLEGV